MFDTGHPAWIRDGVVVGLVTVVVALVSVATGGIVVVPVLGPLDLAVGLAIPLALLFGGVTAIGVAAGVVLSAVWQATLSWWTVVDAVGYGGLAYLSYRLWGVLPAVATRTDPRLRSPGQVVEFAAVTVLSGVATAAVLAWAALIGWGSPFGAVVLAELGIIVLSTGVVGWILLPATALVDPPAYGQRTPIAVGEGAFWAGVVGPLLWVAVGTVFGLAGGSQRVQILLGALALSLVVATYRPRDPDQSAESPQSTEP